MAPFSVIVFGVVVWMIAVSEAKQLRFSFENGLVWTGLKGEFKCNRPFAGSGHMVLNKLHWDANDVVGLPKQSKVGLDW